MGCWGERHPCSPLTITTGVKRNASSSSFLPADHQLFKGALQHMEEAFGDNNNKHRRHLQRQSRVSPPPSSPSANDGTFVANAPPLLHTDATNDVREEKLAVIPSPRELNPWLGLRGRHSCSRTMWNNVRLAAHALPFSIYRQFSCRVCVCVCPAGGRGSMSLTDCLCYLIFLQQH